MSRLTRDGTAKPVSRDQILRRERGQGNIYFPCSADHEQGWQPYPVDPYSSYMCVTIQSSMMVVYSCRVDASRLPPLSLTLIESLLQFIVYAGLYYAALFRPLLKAFTLRIY